MMSIFRKALLSDDWIATLVTRITWWWNGLCPKCGGILRWYEVPSSDEDYDARPIWVGDCKEHGWVR